MKRLHESLCNTAGPSRTWPMTTHVLIDWNCPLNVQKYDHPEPDLIQTHIISLLMVQNAHSLVIMHQDHSSTGNVRVPVTIDRGKHQRIQIPPVPVPCPPPLTLTN